MCSDSSPYVQFFIETLELGISPFITLLLIFGPKALSIWRKYMDPALEDGAFVLTPASAGHGSSLQRSDSSSPDSTNTLSGDMEASSASTGIASSNHSHSGHSHHTSNSLPRAPLSGVARGVSAGGSGIVSTGGSGLGGLVGLSSATDRDVGFSVVSGTASSGVFKPHVSVLSQSQLQSTAVGGPSQGALLSQGVSPPPSVSVPYDATGSDSTATARLLLNANGGAGTHREAWAAGAGTSTVTGSDGTSGPPVAPTGIASLAAGARQLSSGDPLPPGGAAMHMHSLRGAPPAGAGAGAGVAGDSTVDGMSHGGGSLSSLVSLGGSGSGFLNPSANPALVGGSGSDAEGGRGAGLGAAHGDAAAAPASLPGQLP